MLQRPCLFPLPWLPVTRTLPSLSHVPVFVRPFTGPCTQGWEKEEAGAGFLSSNELLARCLVGLQPCVSCRRRLLMIPLL